MSDNLCIGMKYFSLWIVRGLQIFEKQIDRCGGSGFGSLLVAVDACARGLVVVADVGVWCLLVAVDACARGLVVLAWDVVWYLCSECWWWFLGWLV